MKKEEMNKIIGMLDDDVIADGLSEKKNEGITIRFNRKPSSRNIDVKCINFNVGAILRTKGIYFMD